MFSDKLKSYRNELNLTQEEFASKSGISRSIISQIEAGKRPPSKAVLIKLSEHSGKSIDWWYGKEDEEKEYGSLNALDVLIDYMIENNIIDSNGNMDEKSKEYIWKLLNAEIMKKVKDKNRG